MLRLIMFLLSLPDPYHHRGPLSRLPHLIYSCFIHVLDVGGVRAWPRVRRSVSLICLIVSEQSDSTSRFHSEFMTEALCVNFTSALVKLQGQSPF